MRLDPGSAALYALVAVALVTTGATLSGSVDVFSITDRASVMVAVVTVLAGVAVYARRRHRDDPES